jgi:hypothetical protein
MTLRDGRIIDGTTFYDSISFNELWARVQPPEISHPVSLGQQPGHLADRGGLARYAVQAVTAPREHEQPRLTRSCGSFRCRTTRRETGSERGCRGLLMPYTCPTGSGKAGASK